jgi:hypothetical protein
MTYKAYKNKSGRKQTPNKKRKVKYDSDISEEENDD